MGLVCSSRLCLWGKVFEVCSNCVLETVARQTKGVHDAIWTACISVPREMPQNVSEEVGSAKGTGDTGKINF